jgi:Zn-dependent protease
VNDFMLQHMDLKTILYMLPVFLIGLTVHEFAHALVAYKMGDNTPMEQGRLTLNPLPHIDLFGFLLFLFVGIGWAKPVPINPAAFKRPKSGEVWVSLAGPFANLMLAVLFGFFIKVLIVVKPAVFEIPQFGELLGGFLYSGILVNIMLMVVNLLPIPPLDGSHLLLILIPDRFRQMKLRVLQFGALLIFVLFMLENILDTDIIPLSPLIKLLFNQIITLLRIG